MPRKIEVSHKTIIFTVVFLISLWFVFMVKDIILQFFLALLVMTALDPIVTKLSNLKIPRALAISITYLLVFGIFGIALVSLIPPLVNQTTSFAVNLPVYLNKLPNEITRNTQIVDQAIAIIGSLPSQLLTLSLYIFSNVIEIIVILIFAFYLLLSRDKFDEQIGIFFNDDRKRFIKNFIDTLEFKLGGWARGQFLLMVFMGLITYIYLTILRIPYSLPLAILAAILEIVPFLGPVLAAAPAVLIGIGISPLTGLTVAILAFLAQQLEGYVLVPKIMQKSAGVSPIVVLLSLSVGFRLAGLFGTLIAVPVFITLQVVLQKYLELKT